MKQKDEMKDTSCCQFTIEGARNFVQELKDNKRKQVLFGKKDEKTGETRPMTHKECFKKFDWLESKGFIMIPCCNNYDRKGFCKGHKRKEL